MLDNSKPKAIPFYNYPGNDWGDFFAWSRASCWWSSWQGGKISAFLHKSCSSIELLKYCCKVLGAHRAGLTTVILPAANMRDVQAVPDNVKEALTFIPVSWRHSFEKQQMLVFCIYICKITTAGKYFGRSADSRLPWRTQPHPTNSQHRAQQALRIYSLQKEKCRNVYWTDTRGRLCKAFILILTATRLFPAQSTYRVGATPF